MAGNDDDDQWNAAAATVGGGISNKATWFRATVGGGADNAARGAYATIAGGGPAAGGVPGCDGGDNHGFVCGGCSSDPTNLPCSSPDDCPDPQNETCDPTDSYCTGGGVCRQWGTGNQVYDDFGTIGGGGLNRAGSDDGDTENNRFATVAGGQDNNVYANAGTIAGGSLNPTGPVDLIGTVGGGINNQAGDNAGTTLDAQYIDCITNEECATDPRATFCTFDSCEGGICAFTPGLFGDVAGAGGACGQDGDVALNDILAVLDGFAGQFREPCTRSNIDIGGSGGSCVPDGNISLSDILHVLDAFSGSSSCTAICNASGRAVEARPVRRSARLRSGSARAASFTLVPAMPAARGGDLIEVEAFVSGASDIRGYELAVEALADASLGGRRMRLKLVDVSIDTTRADYLLHGVEHVTAVDAAAGRLAAAAYTGGVAISDDAYVGTFTFRASSNAAGLFRLNVRSADTTVLDSTETRIAVESSSASIRVGPPTDGRVGSKPIRRGRR